MLGFKLLGEFKNGKLGLYVSAEELSFKELMEIKYVTNQDDLSFLGKYLILNSNKNELYFVDYFENNVSYAYYKKIFHPYILTYFKDCYSLSMLEMIRNGFLGIKKHSLQLTIDYFIKLFPEMTIKHNIDEDYYLESDLAVVLIDDTLYLQELDEDFILS